MFSLFKGFGQSKAPHELNLQRSLGCDKGTVVWQWLQQRNYSLAEENLPKLTWEEMVLSMDTCTCSSALESQLEQWYRQAPGSYWAGLFYSSFLTWLAWEVRSGARASEVGEEQAEGFLRHLGEAEAVLNQLNEQHPEQDEAWARQIRVKMGLGYPLDDIWPYFQATIDRNPHNLVAYITMADAVNPKWLGDLETMYGFADDVCENRDDNVFLILKLFCMVEHQLYLTFNDETAEEAENFFDQPGVEETIKSVYTTYHEGPSTHFKWYNRLFHSYMAYCLFYAGIDRNTVKEEMARAANIITQRPWCYQGIETYKELAKRL